MAESDFFSLENWVDRLATVITPSAEDPLNRAPNVANINIDRFWRVTGLTAGATDYSIMFDFGENMPIGAFMFMTPRANTARLGDFHLSIGRTDTVQWQFWADGLDPLIDPVTVDTGVLPADVREGYGVHCPAPPAVKFNARYCKCTIDAISRQQIIAGPLVENGFADISRFWIGDRFDPENNHTYRHKERWKTQSLSVINPREASVQTDRGAHYREWDLTYSGISDAETAMWRRFNRLVADDNQFLLGHSRTASDIPEEIMLCMRTNPDDGLESVGPDFWEMPVNIREAI